MRKIRDLCSYSALFAVCALGCSKDTPSSPDALPGVPIEFRSAGISVTVAPVWEKRPDGRSYTYEGCTLSMQPFQRQGELEAALNESFAAQMTRPGFTWGRRNKADIAGKPALFYEATFAKADHAVHTLGFLIDSDPRLVIQIAGPADAMKSQQEQFSALVEGIAPIEESP